MQNIFAKTMLTIIAACQLLFVWQSFQIQSVESKEDQQTTLVKNGDLCVQAVRPAELDADN